LPVRLTMVMACLYFALRGGVVVAEPYTWDLHPVFDDRSRWSEGVSGLAEQADALAQCPDRLAEGGGVLSDCLERRFRNAGLVRRTQAWARLRAFDRASGEEPLPAWSRTLAACQRAFARFDAAAARLDPATVEALPGVVAYRAWFGELWRSQAHMPAPATQDAVVLITDTARPFQAIYRAITDEPLVWPSVTLSDGQFVRVDPLSYAHLMWRPDADDRYRVSELYWAAWDVSLNLLAVSLNGRFQADARLATARSFDRVRDQALFEYGLPADTLSRVRNWADQGRDTLGTGFRLRGYVLGTGDVGAANRHVPLGPVPAYTLEDARGILEAALAPLHGLAATVIAEGFDNGWFQETPGHPGFVVNAGSGTHPYIGIDYREDVLSLLELARLWGMALHIHFSADAQPVAAAEPWPLTTDTVATVAELLVVDYLARTAQNDEQRLAWLSVALDFWYRRFFRPAALTDFEDALRDWAALEDPFSKARLNRTFDQTLSGIHAEAVRDEAALRIGWAAEQGLYDPYSGLRQALATVAAAELAHGLLRKGGTQPTAFRKLLASGRSESPAALLSAAGVALDGDEAYQRVLQATRTTLDEMTPLVPDFVDRRANDPR
jgi:oligoendopeptidase F